MSVDDRPTAGIGSADGVHGEDAPVSSGSSRARRAMPILHFLSTQRFASPFDANMAVDAGYKVVIPHCGVTLDDTRALVQDAIFSRPPGYANRTGIFIGGKDALLALDMLEAARQALVPPFEVSVFADPGGSFTTAAAMVAIVEAALRKHHRRTLSGATLAVFGATGVVGFAASVIAAHAGASVIAVTHCGLEALMPYVIAAEHRFGVELHPREGAGLAEKSAILAECDVVLSAAAAGVRVLPFDLLASSSRLAIAADVNAVPPPGIEGVELMDDARRLDGTGVRTIGPLAIGDLKYRVQAALFRRMLRSRTPLLLDFRDAYDEAKSRLRARR